MKTRQTVHAAATGRRRTRSEAAARTYLPIPRRIKRLGIIIIGAALALPQTLRSAELRFTEPVPMPEPINDEHANLGPSLPGDGLALYFSSNRPGGQGGVDIWVSRRASTGEAWGPPVNLAVVNSTEHELTGSVSSDELELYFSRGDPSDIWVSTRRTAEEPWPEPVKLGPTVNRSDTHEDDPFISADKLELYFDSFRTGIWQIYVARRSSPTEEFGAPQLIPGAGSYACLAPNGLTLFQFGSGANNNILYKSRQSTEEDFGPRGLGIRDLRSPHRDIDPFILPDGTLFFASNRPGLPVPPYANPAYAGEYGIWSASLMPSLSCDGRGDALCLSWPAFPDGFRLESCLTMDGTWSPVEGRTTEGAHTLEVTVPKDAEARFFRLRKH